MPILVSGKLVMSLVMLAIFAGMVLMSLAYPPDARLLPLVIGIPGIALALLQVVMEVIAARNSGEHMPRQPSNPPVGGYPAPAAEAAAKSEPQSLWPQKEEVVLFAYLVGLAISLIFLGFWITIPLFLVAFLRINEGIPWPKILTLTAIGWGALFLVFDVLLGVVPHEGFLIEYFSG